MGVGVGAMEEGWMMHWTWERTSEFWIQQCVEWIDYEDWRYFVDMAQRNGSCMPQCPSVRRLLVLCSHSKRNMNELQKTSCSKQYRNYNGTSPHRRTPPTLPLPPTPRRLHHPGLTRTRRTRIRTSILSLTRTRRTHNSILSLTRPRHAHNSILSLTRLHTAIKSRSHRPVSYTPSKSCLRRHRAIPYNLSSHISSTASHTSNAFPSRRNSHRHNPHAHTSTNFLIIPFLDTWHSADRGRDASAGSDD